MTKAKLYFTGTDTQEIDNLETTNLSVSGITTTSKLTVQGNTLITGITTFGLGIISPPPSNSQLSFELTNNTNLRIRVRGTDGVLRSADITLA